MYLVKALDETRSIVSFNTRVNWVADQVRMVDDRYIGFYQEHSDVFEVLSGPTLGLPGTAIANSFLLTIEDSRVPRSVSEELGVPAIANIDFNTTGESASSVTIGGVIYLEADTAVPATGVWTNGASAADSATSLIAAINGDTRATVPFTALADVSGDGVLLVADTVGTDGNLTITTDSSSAYTVRSFVNGADADAHEVSRITHTVTTQELLSGAIEIPVSFTPTGFNITAVSATGAPVYFTDLVTIEASPDRITITTDGGTNLADTNIVHLTVFNEQE